MLPAKVAGGCQLHDISILYMHILKVKCLLRKKGQASPCPSPGATCLYHRQTPANVNIYEKIHSKCRNFNYIGFVDLNIEALHTTLSHFHRRQEKRKRVNFAPVKRVF